jgi:hypothetical protein
MNYFWLSIEPTDLSAPGKERHGRRGRLADGASPPDRVDLRGRLIDGTLAVPVWTGRDCRFAQYLPLLP